MNVLRRSARVAAVALGSSSLDSLGSGKRDGPDSETEELSGRSKVRKGVQVSAGAARAAPDDAAAAQFRGLAPWLQPEHFFAPVCELGSKEQQSSSLCAQLPNAVAGLSLARRPVPAPDIYSGDLHNLPKARTALHAADGSQAAGLRGSGPAVVQFVDATKIMHVSRLCRLKILPIIIIPRCSSRFIVHRSTQVPDVTPPDQFRAAI